MVPKVILGQSSSVSFNFRAHVDNDDFFLVAPRPLPPLRHALGRSLISLQGSRRIGHTPPLYQRILRLYWDAATPSTRTFLMLCICILNCRGLKLPMVYWHLFGCCGSLYFYFYVQFVCRIRPATLQQANIVCKKLSYRTILLERGSPS